METNLIKQARRWVFESAADSRDITEVNFKQELLKEDGEPMEWVVDFYEGRLRPFNPETDQHVKPYNS